MKAMSTNVDVCLKLDKENLSQQQDNSGQEKEPAELKHLNSINFQILCSVEIVHHLTGKFQRSVPNLMITSNIWYMTQLAHFNAQTLFAVSNSLFLNLAQMYQRY